ncbi:NAD(P)/FAD-dependent oxidoreductase [Rhodopirellula europaea]|uniref:NAD binding site n=1 Tax=Rhodopirellula europaea 6C TaxID=1263867 RepID=M2B0Q0_9BACT|nr:FAD-dependent oxidoreductase [Rhodopirellula europaea]EMB15819.1 NAD binding site [Rhodopirellula europaea 6C]
MGPAESGSSIEDQGLGKVAIVGAGVAGSAAAIRFAQRGAKVTLFERSVFPREKVCGCCLGAAGLAALDAIGAGESIRDLGLPTKFFRGYFQVAKASPTATQVTEEKRSRVPAVRIPIREGIALSRAELDQHLLTLAIEAGVQVRQPCEATIVAESGESVSIDAGTGSPETFDLVVVAAGLTGRFRQRDAADLRWLETPNGPMGLSAHMSRDEAKEIDWKLESGEIQMHCGRDGYVGIVCLPNGSLDIAAAVHPGKKTPSVMGGGKVAIQMKTLALLLDSGLFDSLQSRKLKLWFAEVACWQTTPPLRRRRVSGRGRVVAIGDAAGYVEPLTGEGMTWGIESGLAVADSWALYRLGQMTANGEADFGANWDRRAAKFQTRRRYLCRWVTGMVRYRPARWLACHVLRRAHWLATPFTRSLANGPRFDATSSIHRTASSFADASLRTHVSS